MSFGNLMDFASFWFGLAYNVYNNNQDYFTRSFVKHVSIWLNSILSEKNPIVLNGVKITIEWFAVNIKIINVTGYLLTTNIHYSLIRDVLMIKKKICK